MRTGPPVCARLLRIPYAVRGNGSGQGSRSDCSPSTAILIHSFPKTVQRHSIYEDYAVVWDVSLGTGINGSVV